MPVKAIKKPSSSTVKNLKSKAIKKARPVDDALAEFREIAEARYKIAKSTYDAQDGQTQEVIDRIRDRLRIAATGVVNINGRPFKLEQQYVNFNIWFIAVEIVSDLALNGIRVENFKFNELYCAECKKQILRVPMSKGRKEGRRKR